MKNHDIFVAQIYIADIISRWTNNAFINEFTTLMKSCKETPHFLGTLDQAN